MDDVCDCSPDDEFLIFAYLDGGKFGVCCLQKDLSGVLSESLHREFPVDHGDDNLAV